MTKVRFNMFTKSKQQQEATPMLGDPLPYPRKGHRTNIQQLPAEVHAAATGPIWVDVKALNGAIVYQDYDIPLPIPEDDFIPVELTPTIVQAVNDGDLEQRGKPYTTEESAQEHEPRGTRRAGRHPSRPHTEPSS